MRENGALVRLETRDQVAIITLDSQHNRNALSRQLVRELGAHVDAACADDDVHAIHLRSSGRVFCSGADLAEASTGGMVEGAVALVDLQRRLATSTKPVVVELAGPVRAGGLGIVGAADIVVAAESVTFQLTEVRLAVAPAVISLSLLPRLTDRAAADLFLTARAFDAREAVTLGLLTRVAPDDELRQAVSEVLTDLRQARPQGLAHTKRLLNRELVARIDALGDEVASTSADLFDTDEARAAVAAFLARGR